MLLCNFLSPSGSQRGFAQNEWNVVDIPFQTGGEKDPTGVKNSKERITILGCGNAAGSNKTKLFVIGKSAKPRAFKNAKVFPVIYRSNERAWMTQQLMNEWFKKHFVPEAHWHLSGNGFPADTKILLI
ncbi:Tigger transposable element-derived protein 2 [Araneus ventricosus]|uniref:Tigger transposable element-derived protein 2 n=1 Tax=Araneus ventricosus TaxID=182803 RepID=A0A4Y2RKZ8_ARAVE|nr:Tigger transposable element-derived protein 2 [Araneus ventricosus]